VYKERVNPRSAPAADRDRHRDPVNVKDLPRQQGEPLREPEEPLEPEEPTRTEVRPEPVKPAPDDTVSSEPDPSDNDNPHPRKDWTDPPESRPDPKGEKYADPGNDVPVLVSAWKADGLKVWRAGAGDKAGERVEAGEEFLIRKGDRVQPKGTAEFTLVDGTLLRAEGELTFSGETGALSLILHDGALYADTASPLAVNREDVSLSIDGVAVLEERLHGMDVFCISGRVNWGAEFLAAGRSARLEKDGFRREKPITWADVQREFKFLKDPPTRAIVVEELVEEPGNIFGGELVDGVLVGEVDGDVGIGFYLREPYSFGDGDVVRFRFRVEKACEMILQFGTVEEGNWRHKMGGIKAGEWVDYEIPLVELYKTTDVARKAAPGLSLKFFQLHPEDAESRIEIDRVEIVHKP
jgi:hypothetical protein